MVQGLDPPVQGLFGDFSSQFFGLDPRVQGLNLAELPGRVYQTCVTQFPDLSSSSSQLLSP